MGDKVKTYYELRKQKYDNILDEVYFICRATEGAVSAEWVMNLPISNRLKYVEELNKELKEREAKLNS